MIKRFFVILFFIFLTNSVAAQERVAGDSAVLTLYARGIHSEKISYRYTVAKFLAKKKAIQSLLVRNNSPLANSADSFVNQCRDERLNCYLLPAIAGLESGFGQYILPASYNPFGWGGGYTRFTSWSEAIHTVGQGLKDRYIGSGAYTVDQIGRMYAVSPTWSVRVRRFIAQFEAEEEKQLNSVRFPIEL